MTEHWFSEEVQCRKCKESLGYLPGSPRDRHDETKLCSSCKGKAFAEETLMILRCRCPDPPRLKNQRCPIHGEFRRLPEQESCG